MTKWSIMVGPGWHGIVDRAVAEIEKCGGHITQVKEKFGGLRIYAHGDGVDEICDKAESEAKNKCEECGRPGKLLTDRFRMKTLCAEHGRKT